MSVGKKTFTLKTYGAKLYEWSPVPVYKSNTGKNNQRPFYCTATAGSQGQDWITTYSYDIVVIDGRVEHSAYVACDYVE